MTWGILIWIVVGLVAAWIIVVIARAVDMHFALKKQLRAEGMNFEKGDKK
jgi:predicted phage gp36 major capsid-like protein